MLMPAYSHWTESSAEVDGDVKPAALSAEEVFKVDCPRWISIVNN